MRTFINGLLKILGVIFLIILLSGTYLYFTDAYGVRTLVSVMTADQPASMPVVREEATNAGQVQETVQKDANPYLSETQEAALENVGINPAALPTSVSDTQKTCLINAVGEARANEIKAGAMPTPVEIFKAQSCL